MASIISAGAGGMMHPFMNVERFQTTIDLDPAQRRRVARLEAVLADGRRIAIDGQCGPVADGLHVCEDYDPSDWLDIAQALAAQGVEADPFVLRDLPHDVVRAAAVSEA
jgi:hypothetical protein